ncbi:MAG: hypothetical protein ACRDUW_10865 [Pseudonocardiaceae bacterium]
MTITDYIYVWRARPAAAGTLVPLVRAANGKSHSASDGYNFAHNYEAWCAHYNMHLPAWTYFYPGDSGAAVADALLSAAPHAPFYVIDAEDPTCPSKQLSAFAATVRRSAPAWLSTYGNLKQALGQKVELTHTHWDVITPQKYYHYQDTPVTEWQPYCGKVLPSIAPADYHGWRNIARHGPVAVWEFTTVDPVKMSAELARLPGRTEPQPPRQQPPGNCKC